MSITLPTTTGPAHVDDPNFVVDSTIPTQRTAAGYFSEKEGDLLINPEVWKGDPLAKWRGKVDGKTPPPNVLSNPARTDGLAIPRGYDPDGVYKKDDAVVSHRDLAYTEGNWWPDAKGGALRGSDILRIENNAGGGILFAGSMTPGYEQAGAAMTPVKSGTKDKFVPTPAFGWLEQVGLSQYGQPQIWISKLNMDPGQVEGWHQSGARQNDDPKIEDHGTPAFPYGIIVRDNGPDIAPSFSFSSSEGYDPAITKEPGYGMMLIATVDGVDHVAAALSIQDVTATTGNGVGWGNPSFGFESFVNTQGGVTVTAPLQAGGVTSQAGGTLPEGTLINGITYRLRLEKTETVDAFLKKQAEIAPDSVTKATHVSVPDGV